MPHWRLGQRSEMWRGFTRVESMVQRARCDICQAEMRANASTMLNHRCTATMNDRICERHIRGATRTAMWQGFERANFVVKNARRARCLGCGIEMYACSKLMNKHRLHCRNTLNAPASLQRSTITKDGYGKVVNGAEVADRSARDSSGSPTDAYIQLLRSVAIMNNTLAVLMT